MGGKRCLGKKKGERGGKSSRLEEEYRSRQGATDRGGLGRDADMEEDAEDQTLAGDSQGEKPCESERVVEEERYLGGEDHLQEKPETERVQERRSERKKGRHS